LEKEGYESGYSRSVFKQRLDKEDRVIGLESIWIRRDGATVHVRENARAIRDKDGNILYYEGTLEDITKYKQAEEILRESEEKFKTFAEQSPNMIFINKGGRIVYVNNKCEESMGYKREFFYSPDFDFLTMIAPEYLDLVKENFRKHQAGEDIPPYEYALITKEGKRIEAINNSKLIDYEGERAILGIVTDITERKLAEKALQESEEKYRMLVEESLQGLVITQGFPPRIVFVNSKAADIVSSSVDEVMALSPKDMMELVHVEDQPAFRQYFQKREARDLLPASFEFRIVRRDKIVRWVETFSTNIFFLDKPAVQTAIIDITERKQAEIKLREQEEYHSNLIQNSSDLVSVLEEDGTIRYLSPSAEQLLGYKPADLVDTNLFEYLPPEDIHHIQAYYDDAVNKPGVTPPVEHRLRRADGSWVFVESIGNNLLDNPVVEGLIINSRDITLRKQAEEELRKYQEQLEELVDERTAELQKTNKQLEEEIEERKSVEKALTETKTRLEYVLSSSPAVLYISKASGDYAATYISENIRVQLGYKPQDFLDNPNFWVKHIHPEDRPTVLRELTEALEKGYHTHDYRFLHKDGSYRWMRDEFKVTRDASGKPEIIGYWIDIADRKEAEEKLRQSEETNRALLNATTDSAMLLDLDGTFLAINEVAAKRLGKPVEGLVGTRAYDLFSPDLAKSREARASEVIRSRKPIRYEDEREGRIYDTSAYPVFDSRRRVVQLAIFARDITDRKEAELRNQIKAQLLNDLRDSKTVEDCLQLGCQAIRDARLFERAVLTLHNDRREITHLGQVGLDQKVIERARKASPPDEDLTKKMTHKKFQISHSFFIPQEAILAYQKTGRYIPQILLRGKEAATWKPGDELFVPIISKDSSVEGYLSVDTPTNGERPKWNTILYLEDVVDIVAKQIREMQNMIRLQNSEQKYRELTDLLPQTVFEIDLKGNLTFTNRYGFESFGYTQKDLDQGLNVRQIFEPESTERITQNIGKRLRGESFEDHDYTALTKDGRTFPVLIYSSPIIHDDKPVGLRGIVLDITERKRAEDELRAERDKLDLITRNIGVGLAIISKDYRTLWANEVLKEIFGDVEGKVCYTTYNQRTDVCPGCGVQKVFTTGKASVVHEQVGKDADGKTIWSQIIATPIKDEKGNITAAHEVVVPITERKRMELTQRALQQIANAVHTTKDLNELFGAIHLELGSILNTENFFIALLDKENDAVFFPYHKDERDPWVETLPAGKTLTGYVIRHEKPLLATGKEIERLAQTGKIEILGVIPKIWLGVPMKARGDMIGALVVQNYANETALGEKDLQILQFTSGQIGLSIQHKRAEDELRQTLQELARSNAELEQFAYVASHDLQEPLQAVAMSVDIVAKRYEDKLDKEANKFIGYAVNESNRMQMLVEDLLAYSRVGKGDVEFEPTDCLLVLDQTLDNLLVPIERSHAKITHGPLPTVMGDPLQLTQLFQNLIDNAIKFCGQEPPSIHVSARRKGDEWVFSVRDKGIGFDSQHVERIFKAFERLLSKTEYPGTGIGLAICRKIVERHGGRIWAKSELGKGATFYFTFPVMKGTSRKVKKGIED
jgi:PAS domain S-box-containing protein